MEYDLILHGDYIEAVVVGEFDLTDGRKCVDETFRLCEKHALQKVLVNGLRMSDNVTIGSRFNLGEYLAARTTQRVRVAILTSTTLVHESKALQNTANNRGANVITTDSIETARAFLGLIHP